ncbi:MAG: hypothetical protein ABJ275_00185 [Maricaulaceae bacterium]
MKILNTTFILALGFLTSTSAQALDIKFKSSVSDQEVSKACRQATGYLHVKPSASICQNFNVSNIVRELESQSYTLLGSANNNLLLHDYKLAVDGGASKYKLEAMRTKLPKNYPSGAWLSPPQGRYLDIANINGISIQYDLVRIDFRSNDTAKTYDYYSTGIFSAREHTSNYHHEGLIADYHFRYTVKSNGRTLYDGFILETDNLTSSFRCVDGVGSRDYRACREGVGQALRLDVVSDEFSANYLTAKVLTGKKSVFSDMTAYYKKNKLAKSDIQAQPFNSLTSAQRTDMARYAGSFQVIEGGRATFQFKQLPIYTAAQQNGGASTSGGGIANTAKYLADQQYCAQYAKSTVQEDRSFRSGLGYVAGIAGFGEVASTINTASHITNISEGLSGRELKEANECMQSRGHSSIAAATAKDAAYSSASTYVPYTSGAAAPQPQAYAPSSSYQGSASTYGNSPQTVSPSVPSYQGSASSYASAPQASEQQAALSGSASRYEANVSTTPAVTPLGDKVGSIMLVDTDFGFVTAQASGLQIGDIVQTQTSSGQLINFTVAKQSSNGNYSLTPNDGASLNGVQAGNPIAK